MSHKSTENHFKNLFNEFSDIGLGSFGTVFKAKHILDNQLYAVNKNQVSK